MRRHVRYVPVQTGSSIPNVEVLAAEADFLAINKPPGIPFHTVGPKQGILQIVRTLEERGDIPAGERLYPVHRLDQITSGILIFARGRANANALSNEFRHSRAQKIYVALSDRKPTKKQGHVVGDMVRGRRGSWILARTTHNPAVTDFVTAAVNGRRPGLRVFVLRPRTGRTHQIRVAMKSLGAPVLGDGMYGRFDTAREEERAYLHAAALRFTLNGREVILRCPPAPGVEYQSKEFLRAYAPFEKAIDVWPGPGKADAGKSRTGAPAAGGSTGKPRSKDGGKQSESARTKRPKNRIKGTHKKRLRRS